MKATKTQKATWLVSLPFSPFIILFVLLLHLYNETKDGVVYALTETFHFMKDYYTAPMSWDGRSGKDEG
jgi:hypothetical protein